MSREEGGHKRRQLMMGKTRCIQDLKAKMAVTWAVCGKNKECLYRHVVS